MAPNRQDHEVLGAVLVHALWHGGWVWDAVRRELDEAGVASAVVDLPMTDLRSDVAAVRRVLDELDRPAVLVGHSYGGAVITEAGDHPHATQLSSTSPPFPTRRPLGPCSPVLLRPTGVPVCSRCFFEA